MLLCFFFAKGQNMMPYNINIYNGLPSNHVYSVIRDNYGYLWMCTTNGVVKYNGYSCKVFNFSDGLPRNDVFGLYMDHKNRIWLRCISDKLGYIYKDVYHNVPVLNSDNVLYPKHIVDYDKGVLFAGKVNTAISFAAEKNDTIRLMDTTFAIAEVAGYGGVVVSDRNNKTISRLLYRDGKPLKVENTCVGDMSLYSEDNSFARRIPFEKYLVQFIIGTNELVVLNTYNCAYRKITLADSNKRADVARFAYYQHDKLYVICDRNIYEFDTGIRVKNTYAIGSMLPDAPGKPRPEIVSFYTDNFWKNCITTTGGIYFDQGEGKHFVKTDLDLSAFTLLGNANDTLVYWWSEQYKRLLSVGASGHVSVTIKPEFSTAAKIIPYAQSRALLLTRGMPHWFYYQAGKLEHIEKQSIALPNMRTYDAVLNYDSTVFITGSATGPWQLRFFKDSVSNSSVNEYWYRYLASDALRKMVWAYNTNHVLLHTKSRDFVINDAILKNYGINNIERIFIHDKSGNVFLKDYDNLFVFDINHRTITSLFRTNNIKDSRFFINKDKIILAGRFGLLFSKIDRSGNPSDPVVYPNARDYWYHVMEEVTIAGETILLKTDNGVYKVAIPADAAFEQKQEPTYLFKALVNYKNELYSIPMQQRLAIDQEDNKLQFDIINSKGSGALHYKYRINGVDSAWKALDNGLLYLPKLDVARQYTISLIANDDVWRSNTIAITFLIEPYWWQTNKGIVIILIIAIVIIADILSWVIAITRKHAARVDEKRRATTELELRAVYSQLNPHFIFNTLNSALHFIKKNKMEEAFEHVSKFSRLLRAYLESSRNRFITIADEIANLKNYIELLQTRFGNKFTYAIHTNGLGELYNIFIPSLLLQPIVENAIIHGLLSGGDGCGHLDISFEKKEPHTIICVIDDNGIGREKAAGSIFENRKSFGNELLRELINLFNRQDKMGIDITYIDKKHHQGTTVIVTITKPLYEKSF